MGYSNVFLKHGLSCFKEDGVLSYMKDVLYVSFQTVAS